MQDIRARRELRFQVEALLSIFQLRKPRPPEVTGLTPHIYYVASFWSHFQKENAKTFGLMLKQILSTHITVQLGGAA